jgi:hypothetical protein
VALEAAFAAVTIGDGTARGVVCRAHARRLCEGHFPGEPIVPGAQLAGLMAELAAARGLGRPRHAALPDGGMSAPESAS